MATLTLGGDGVYALAGGLETEQATTSGTEFDFTGIRSDAVRITVIFDDVSLDGTDHFLVQIGDSGGFETTGYNSTSNSYNAGTTQQTITATDGFAVFGGGASRTLAGHMVLTKISGNKWVASHQAKIDNTSRVCHGGGRKELSGTLDKVRLTRDGTDSFDNGSVNILVE